MGATTRRHRTAGVTVALTTAVLCCAPSIASAAGTGPSQAVPRPGIRADGGAMGNYCNSLKVNGKSVSWEQYYTPVDHSIPIHVKNVGRTFYCLDPKWDSYDCMAAIVGLAFTLYGAGIELRAVIATVGGIGVSIPGIWSAC